MESLWGRCGSLWVFVTTFLAYYFDYRLVIHKLSKWKRANSSGPKRVPWGMPPFNLQGGEEDVAILTTCDLPSRNDAIHLNKQEWTNNLS